MVNSIVSGIQNVVQDAKVASTVSVGTATTGTMTWLEVIPSDIGKLATIVGIVLSTILIWTHLEQRSHKRERRIEEKERHELEMQVLTAELQKHREE